MDQRARVSNNEDVVDVGKVAKRHRRPTGAPPPLPKSIGATGVFRLALVFIVVIPGCIWLHVNPGPLDRFDAAITDAVVSLRTGWLDSLARNLEHDRLTLRARPHRSGSPSPPWRGSGAGGTSRLFLIGVAIVGLSLEGLLLLAARPRPFGVTIIGHWEGYSAPSVPMAGLAVVVAGIVVHARGAGPAADARQVRRAPPCWSRPRSCASTSGSTTSPTRCSG